MNGDPLPLDQGSVRAAVGISTFARGLEYAEGGAVESVAWRPDVQVVIGKVAGTGRMPYLTNVILNAGPDGRFVFISSDCSCPVRYNCKHAVALALAAARPPEPEPSWEDPWRSLLEPAEPPPAPLVEPHTLAIELSLRRTLSINRGGGREPIEVWARVVRAGKRGWVAGDLSWGRLGGLRARADYPKEQIRILHDLHALYLARTGSAHLEYNLRYGDERQLELTAINSNALMPLLKQAADVGIRFIHADAALGDLLPLGYADLCLDVVVHPDETLVVTPTLRTDYRYGEVVPVAFLGNGSGAVVRSAAWEVSANPGTWPIRLMLLNTPAPAALRPMALGPQPHEVPASQRERFLEEYFPRLRRLAEVVSSDGSFDVPQTAAPTLVLRADFGENHLLDLQWEWAYRLGEVERRLPLGSVERAAFRDPAAEAECLSRFDSDLAGYGLTRSTGPGVGDPVQISGMDTMQFVTEWLPRLRNRDDLRLEITGTPADYREAGDSLRIAVSTKAQANDDDWYDLGVSITVDGETVPFLDVFVALAQGRSHLLLPGGVYFSLEKPELMALRRLIDEARLLSDTAPGELRISRYQTGLWQELEALGVVERQAASWLKHVAAVRNLETVGNTPLPVGLHAELRPYQVEGYEWLAFLWEHRLGGILADDMGLGKTLQALALIAHARETEPDAPPFLIVAPTSVVSNWAAEAARFTPGLRVVTVTESERKARRTTKESIAELTAGADLVVTSYALLRIDDAAYQRQRWSGLLLDEAQFVKNRKTGVHRAARKIEAPFKLAITGTPLENSVMELWALLSIAAPGLFPHPEAFKEFYAVPIERNGDTELLATLRRRVRPILKRRTKEDVAPELPPKQEQTRGLVLDPRHRKIYDVTLQRERQKVLKLLNDLEGNRFEILRSLTLLRRLSLHPGLVEPEHLDVPNAKIDALLEHLEAVAGTGHRTLVFSQFTGLLDLIEDRLQLEDIDYCRLDGSTPHRARVIERFKTGTAPVFLISLKAGGFGLNLTEADYCFLMDPWWNPAAEMQAVDRTHRIGQTRTVHVYKLIAEQTIEERVLALQDRKAQLFASVLDGGDGFGRSLTADDIRGLFG